MPDWQPIPDPQLVRRNCPLLSTASAPARASPPTQYRKASIAPTTNIVAPPGIDFASWQATFRGEWRIDQAPLRTSVQATYLRAQNATRGKPSRRIVRTRETSVPHLPQPPSRQARWDRPTLESCQLDQQSGGRSRSFLRASLEAELTVGFIGLVHPSGSRLGAAPLQDRPEAPGFTDSSVGMPHDLGANKAGCAAHNAPDTYLCPRP